MSPALLSMLDRALEDFCTGHGLLLNGNEDAGLPKLASQRIDAVLKTAETDRGQHLIERFVHEARVFIQDIEKGDLPEPEELAAFSDLVLVDLLQTLQAVVSALEEDFAEEMQRRRDRRNEETQRVMDAIQEIQKASRFSRMIAPQCQDLRGSRWTVRQGIRSTDRRTQADISRHYRQFRKHPETSGADLSLMSPARPEDVKGQKQPRQENAGQFYQLAVQRPGRFESR